MTQYTVKAFFFCTFIQIDKYKTQKRNNKNLFIVPLDEFFDAKYDKILNNLFLTWDIGLLSTEHAFKDQNVQTFLKRSDLQFDVVILEQFFHDSWLLFAHKFKAPIVTISTLGHADYFDSAMGFVTPSAFVPHSVLALNDDMTFFERCQNLFWTTADSIIRHYYYMREMQRMANKYLPGLEGISIFIILFKLSHHIECHQQCRSTSLFWGRIKCR